MRRERANTAVARGAKALLAASAVSLLASIGSAAEEDTKFRDLTTYASTVELGTFFNSDNSFKFGDYTGLDDDGWSVLANVDLRRRSAFDAESAYYYRILGLNLGLDSRYIDAEYKRPGLFGVSLFYDEIPKYLTDSAQTFFRNAGASYLTLPPMWVGINNAAQIDPSFFHPNAIDFKRETAGGEVSLILPSHFDFDASYQRQQKKGEKLTSAMIGTTGGTNWSMNVPEPLNHTTHEINSHLRYTTDDLQLQLEYFGSGFYNEHNNLVWETPFLATPLRDPRVAFPDGVAAKGQMPDNWFNQITGSAGLNLPANSRVMLNTAFGWGTQDDAYQPYTVNPLLAVPLGLPRDDLDGKLETRLVSLHFVSKPLPKLGFNLGYRWNDRDNDSPIDTYYRVRADTEDQNPVNARINRPYSFEQHKVDADVSYDIYHRTKLTLLYEWEQITRNLQEVHENHQHTLGAKLVSHPNRFIHFGAHYERSYRERSAYDCVKPLTATEPSLLLADPGCPTTPGTGMEFENQPQLRKYYMANLKRHNLHLWTTVTPWSRVSISSHLNYIDDDYYKSTYGLTEYWLLSSGLDLTYAITDELRFHAFYNLDKSKWEMESVSFNNADASFDPANRWTSTDEDVTNTVGAGFDFDVIPDRLSFGIEYLFAKSTGRIDTTTLAGPVMPPFPDNETTLYDVSVHGNLQITRNLSMRVGYLYENFDSDDWATERICPGCLNFTGSSSVVASGERPPEYDTHLVSLSLIYRFW